MPDTADAFRIALWVSSTEGCPSTTTGIVGWIAHFAGVFDALCGALWTLVIGGTFDAFKAIIPIDADGLVTLTAIIVSYVTHLAGTGHTRRGLIAAIVIA